MTRTLRRGLSLAVGWLADRRIPGPLRAPVYRVYCRLTGADPSSAQLDLRHYPSLGAFFVRRLREGVRPLDPEPGSLISPCDGRIQAAHGVERGTLLQAKGMEYGVAELLGGLGDPAALEGGRSWTFYLSPRDYHRVHAPTAARLSRVAWIPGDRYSVAPKVVARQPRVFAVNERAVLELESDAGTYYLVMVGALNVGRIRVVGVAPGETPAADAPPAFERGAELARFEMGSTVVLVFPRGMVTAELEELGAAVRLGQRLGALAGAPAR